MTGYVALLRAVNVGGTGKLAMADLRGIGEACGFASVSTYIASGNLLFASDRAAGEAKAMLEARLEAHAGRPLGLAIRSAAEMAAVLAANPFADAPGNRVTAIFLDAPPPGDAIGKATGRTTEEIALGLREIFVHYPHGQADTRLRIPAATAGTARNMNTVAKLAALASGL